jgi:hypothetical protein
MTTQLEAYAATNGEMVINGRSFELEGVAVDGDIAVATLKAKRASYTAVRCNNTRVAGLPTAEVWSVIGNKREIAMFAIANGAIKPLRQ